VKSPFVSKPVPPRTLEARIVPIGDLKPFPRNPRRSDLAAIKESLLKNGQYRPIVVNRPTTEVLAGNHTLQAAKELGWSEIAVTYVECDVARRRG
jgi:ParB-like chromosome segregation protein Spo0J